MDIKILSKDQFLLVIGNLLPADETEDISYDQKTYILDYNGGEITQPAEKTEETPSLVFHESFDIAPAYGSVLRFPYFYHVKLHNLLVNVENINIIGSSCASDLTIMDLRKLYSHHRTAKEQYYRLIKLRIMIQILLEWHWTTRQVALLTNHVREWTVSKDCHSFMY